MRKHYYCKDCRQFIANEGRCEVFDSKTFPNTLKCSKFEPADGVIIEVEESQPAPTLPQQQKEMVKPEETVKPVKATKQEETAKQKEISNLVKATKQAVIQKPQEVLVKQEDTMSQQDNLGKSEEPSTTSKQATEARILPEKQQSSVINEPVEEPSQPSANKETTSNDNAPVISTPPPPAPQETRYYVADGQQVMGPFSITTIQKMIELNDVKASTYVCKEGDQQWQQLSNVAELAALLPPVVLKSPQKTVQPQPKHIDRPRNTGSSAASAAAGGCLAGGIIAVLWPILSFLIFIAMIIGAVKSCGG